MINLTHIDDKITDKINPQFAVVDYTPPKSQQKEFPRAVLDPQIYKGDFRAYIPASPKQESYNDLVARMSEQSPTIKEWIANEKINFGKYPQNNGVSTDFENIALQYLAKEGNKLHGYLESKGRQFYKLSQIGTADIGNAAATVAIKGDNAALVGANDFEQKVLLIAQKYHVLPQLARTYVLNHEHVHLSQKNKYAGNFNAERDVEHTLKEFYSQMAVRHPENAVEYNALKKIASARLLDIDGNYSSYSSKGAHSSKGYAKAA